MGAKETIFGSLLAGCLLALLAPVSQATGVTLTATDQGNGGVALTAQASTGTVCYYNCDSNGNNCRDSTTRVSVNIPYYCSNSGEGSASCTYILDRGGLHGTRTFTASASDCKGNSASTTTTTNFDNTPAVTVTGPSGTVSAPFDVTGIATFKPTLQVTKGTITAYVNNGNIGVKACTTETCEYSYQELVGKLYDMNHGGPYPVKLIATGGGATATAEGSFSVDKTPTVSVTSPSGTVSAPFDVTGTATFKPTTSTTKGTITAYVNNGNIGSKACATEVCDYSYNELYKKLYDMNHGDSYPIKMVATGSGATATAEGSFSVDKMPKVVITGPKGTVSEPFDVTGTATFKPTTNATKGTISAYINNGLIGTKQCATEVCDYSYNELYKKLYDMNHGDSYPIKMVATGGGATATAEGTFSVNKMPTVAITEPPAGNVQTPFEIAGTAAFKPTLQATKGTIYAYINNGLIASKSCTTEDCIFSYKEIYGKPYAAAAGTKGTLRLTATGGGASASDEQDIFVEAPMDPPGCPDAQPDNLCNSPCQQ